MSLARIVVLAFGATAVMLAVVVLRAETTRLHYERSQLDRQADVLRREIEEGKLELARLRDPALLRLKAREHLGTKQTDAARE
jgi:hypothetical protein